MVEVDSTQGVYLFVDESAFGGLFEFFAGERGGFVFVIGMWENASEENVVGVFLHFFQEGEIFAGASDFAFYLSWRLNGRTVEVDSCQVVFISQLEMVVHDDFLVKVIGNQGEQSFRIESRGVGFIQM